MSKRSSVIFFSSYFFLFFFLLNGSQTSDCFIYGQENRLINHSLPFKLVKKCVNLGVFFNKQQLSKKDNHGPLFLLPTDLLECGVPLVFIIDNLWEDELDGAALDELRQKCDPLGSDLLQDETLAAMCNRFICIIDCMGKVPHISLWQI